jgi:hypothetical protein
MNEEKAERLRGLVKKARAAFGPRPHGAWTREHYEQCVECQKWSRVRDGSFEKVERDEGMIPGELRATLLMALGTKANALAGPPPEGHAHIPSGEEQKQCPECQEWDKALAAAFEKLSNIPPEELLTGESGFDPECFTKMKAAMLPSTEAVEKAIESGDLPLPPEHMHTHKSQEEFLACDICHGWIKRRDAIFQEALSSHKSEG